MTTFSSTAARWQAVATRDPAATDFVYGVTTTGVYCRPMCPSRLAKRNNIEFYDTPAKAEQNGYRPCKRCKPELQFVVDPHVEIVRQACQTIDSAEGCKPTLHQLATRAKMTPSHFHRVFKKVTGVTTKQYYNRAVPVTSYGQPAATAVTEASETGSPSRQQESPRSAQQAQIQPRVSIDSQLYTQQWLMNGRDNGFDIPGFHIRPSVPSVPPDQSSPLTTTGDTESPPIKPEGTFLMQAISENEAFFPQLSAEDVKLLNSIVDPSNYSLHDHRDDSLDGLDAVVATTTP